MGIELGPMRAWCHDGTEFPVPDGHRFPLAKYRLLRERMAGVVSAREAEPVSWELLGQVHDAEYLRRLRTGALTAREERAMGLPWSSQLVERGRRSTQATVNAMSDALASGYGANLGGGTHHARAASARGYCLFNDVAVAVAAHPDAHVVVIDTDVHQGDGTAELLTGHPRVVTMSIHGASNYPFDRVDSDVDIALPDGTTDRDYLSALAEGMHRAIRIGRPDVVLFIAGADPWQGDSLGRLALTEAGLRERDAFVVHTAEAVGAAICLTLGGGYAPDVADTVRINAASVELVASRYAEVAARHSSSDTSHSRTAASGSSA